VYKKTRRKQQRKGVEREAGRTRTRVGE